MTGRDGAFTLRGLVAGIWELRPELPLVPSVDRPAEPASRWKAVRVMLDDDQEFYLDLEGEFDALAPTQIAGVVRIDGLAFAGALVRLRELRPGPSRGPRDHRFPRDPSSTPEPEPWQARLVTDGFGDFGFGELRSSTDYELRVDVPVQGRLQFLERRVVRTGPNPLGGPVAATIDVATGSLQLNCTERGTAAGNRMLRLRQVGPDGNELARFEILTSPAGIAAVDHLPAGTWTAEPIHGGYCRPAELVVAPAANAAALVEFFGR